MGIKGSVVVQYDYNFPVNDKSTFKLEILCIFAIR